MEQKKIHSCTIEKIRGSASNPLEVSVGTRAPRWREFREVGRWSGIRVEMFGRLCGGGGGT